MKPLERQFYAWLDGAPAPRGAVHDRPNCDICLLPITSRQSWHGSSNGHYHFRCEVLVTKLVVAEGLSTPLAVLRVREGEAKRYRQEVKIPKARA